MDEYEKKLLAFRKQEKRKLRLNQLKLVLMKPMALFSSMRSEEIVGVKPEEEEKDENTSPKSNPVLCISACSEPKPESFDIKGQEESGSAEENFNWRKLIFYVFVWCCLFRYAVYIQFGAVFVILSGFYIIWANTRTASRKSNELSAYSVFNPNCERIEGTFDAEQFDKQIRSGMIF